MTNSSSISTEIITKAVPTDETLPILFQDEYLVAINKPAGLLVHRSPIDRHETRYAVQLLRRQLGQRVYPVHRLDKPTSGVMLFALNREAARQLGEQFSENTVQKAYLAVVRGYCPESGWINHALRADPDPYAGRPEFGEAKPAQTYYQRLATHEIDVEIERYPQSRYSLVLAEPLTGRPHQIRRHMKHISHPIIGDAKHGRGRHNRYFSQSLDCPRLLLHATQLRFTHPTSGKRIALSCPVDGVYEQLLKRFGWLDSTLKLEMHDRLEKVTDT